jgi:thiol:disulfide interchange protein
MLCAAPARAQEPVRWTIAPDVGSRAEAGRKFNILVAAEVDAGWHLYALAKPVSGPQALVFTMPPGRFSLAGAVVEPPPVSAFDKNFNVETHTHNESVVFTVPVAVAGGTNSGVHPLRLDVLFQTCNDTLCLPPTTVEMTLDVAVGVVPITVPVPVSGSARIVGREPLGEAAVGAATAGTAPEKSSASTSVRAPAAAGARAGAVEDLASAGSAGTLAAYMSLAAFMGALSLITPCVFPMVPITVSYFTNRARRSRRDAVMQALVYGLGIVLTFTAVGFTLAVVFGASGLNRFAANPWLNLGVTALFLGFALSLFGVYELALPSRLLTSAARADAGRGRYVGTLLMGLAFTLTSFTCTAPFLGTLLVVASQGDWQWPLAGMAVFATVFALPFVVLALAPQWIASLPRSGSWLTSVKVTMGLLEIAAAVKFLSNVDLVWSWGVFTRPVVLVAWIAIAAVMVAYLVGGLRLGRAPRLGRPGVLRWAVVFTAALAGAWLASGINGRRLGEVEAFLPPADLTGRTPGAELPWMVNDYDAALTEARRQNARVIVDFTGYTCTNCRWMEANMFPQPEVTRELARYVRVRLYTDGRGERYRRHQQMQQDVFGTVALPYYAILTPDGDPVVAFGGLTRDPNQYIAFLRRGLK